MKLTEYLTQIADTIRNHNPHQNEKIKALDFPDEIGRACTESHYIGYSLGEVVGIQQGKQIENELFCDLLMGNGNRDIYIRMFNTCAFPKGFEFAKPLIIKSADITQMFYAMEGNYMPLNIDMSQVPNTATFDRWLSYSPVEHVPYYGWQAPAKYSSTFTYCSKLKTIEKLTTNENTIYDDGKSFVDLYALENITFEGVIGQTIDFRWCSKLTTPSLLSILTALSKDATYASGKTLTLNTASKAKIEADTACSEQLALAVGAGWTIAYA